MNQAQKLINSICADVQAFAENCEAPTDYFTTLDNLYSATLANAVIIKQLLAGSIRATKVTTPAGVPYAKSLLLYALDAQTCPNPWKHWQVLTRDGIWEPCLDSPRWGFAQYRRNPKSGE